MAVHYFKCLFLACLVLIAGADSSDAAGHARHLSLHADSTDENLRAVSDAALPRIASGSTLTAEQEYATVRRRMLDAEEVAIKRIVRKAFGK